MRVPSIRSLAPGLASTGLLVLIAALGFGAFFFDGAYAIISLVAFTAVLLFVARRKLSFPNWSRIAAVLAVLVLGFTYLAQDEVADPKQPTIEDLSPTFPGANLSHAVLMRYGANRPFTKSFRAPSRAINHGFGSGRPERWTNILLEHRASVEADWDDLAPVRAWVDELNGFERIGDLTRAPGDELVGFAPIRAYSEGAIALAGLHALDGRGDEAIATLVSAIEFSNKLEADGRTLMRILIARSVQNQALTAAKFVLENSSPSPSAKARLNGALAKARGGDAGVRRMIALEAAISAEYFTEHGIAEVAVGKKPAPLRAVVGMVEPVLLNRNQTLNAYRSYMHDLGDAAANRDFSGMTAITKEVTTLRNTLTAKNILGSILLTELAPSLTKVAENYWRIEDLRADVRERLKE